MELLFFRGHFLFPKSETGFADQKVLSVPEVPEGGAHCYHNLRKKQTERTVLISTCNRDHQFIAAYRQRHRDFRTGDLHKKEILKIKTKREVL